MWIDVAVAQEIEEGVGEILSRAFSGAVTGRGLRRSLLLARAPGYGWLTSLSLFSTRRRRNEWTVWRKGGDKHDNERLLHNENTCAREATIERSQGKQDRQVVHAFDWGSQSDNAALVHEEVMRVIANLRRIPSVNSHSMFWGAKDGSIYCEYVGRSDPLILVFSTSVHTIRNVVFELGLAIGSGTYVFVLRPHTIGGSECSLRP